jgi:molybdenum cofactor biosynthesis protein B
MSAEEHKAKAKRSIRCFVLTVSDTRDEATDTSGQLIKLQWMKASACWIQDCCDEPVKLKSAEKRLPILKWRQSSSMAVRISPITHRSS